MNSRLSAVAVLLEVLVCKKSLTESFNKHLKADMPGRAFAKELSYGVLRFYNQLAYVAEGLLTKKMKQKDQDVFILILMGLYQLSAMHLPAYAAVKETVEAVVGLKKAWAKNLVNAILRSFLRDQEKWRVAIQQEASVCYAHPAWMLSHFKKDWPDAWQAIAENNNKKPPLTLRINLKKISREQYCEKLAAMGLKSSLHAWVPTAVWVLDPVEVTALPGFMSGECMVQDASAQMAALLLDAQPYQRVLDACAAPGGKTTHLLERVPTLSVLAIDEDASRLTRINENLKRLSLTAEVKVADAATPDKWWDKKVFDRILLDAPCTASGVIRRHPDIKWLRQESDVMKSAKLQQKMINALWPLLKSGGILLYCTCSVFKEENEVMLNQFVAAHADCEVGALDEVQGITLKIGKQILPEYENDGFYYAKLIKK